MFNYFLLGPKNNVETLYEKKNRYPEQLLFESFLRVTNEFHIDIIKRTYGSPEKNYIHNVKIISSNFWLNLYKILTSRSTYATIVRIGVIVIVFYYSLVKIH